MSFVKVICDVKEAELFITKWRAYKSFESNFRSFKRIFNMSPLLGLLTSVTKEKVVKEAKDCGPQSKRIEVKPY